MTDITSRLDPLLENVRSDKIKTREAAVKDLFALLRDGKRVRELVEAGDDDANVYTDLLKAVCRCVEEEKKALAKKETTVALRRLSDATSLLRTAVGHLAARLNRRQALDLLRHLLNVLEHNGSLFKPAAIDYLKALKCLFGHQHHLDNLDSGDWEGLMCMLTRAAFDEDLIGHGVEVLEERFTAKEARGMDLIAALGAENDVKGKTKAKAAHRIVDSDDDAEPSDSASTSAATSRKRSRAPSSRPPPSTPGFSQRPTGSTQTPATQLFSSTTASKALGAGQQRSISHTQIAIFSLLLTLLQQPYNRPLLAHSIAPPTSPSADGEPLSAAFPKSHVALALLYKLLRFLIFYPETTSHLAVLKSVNLVLGVVQLNQLRPVALFADRLLPTLLRLWKSTKSKDVKEQVLVGLRLVFPFVSRNLPTDFGGRPDKNEEAALVEGEGDMDAAEKLTKLKEALDEEVDNRWAVDALQLCSLRLEDARPGVVKAFVARTFKHGPKFEPAQATAWAKLELHADVYAAIDEARQISDASILASTPRSLAKRRRVDNVLEGLLDAIDMSASSAAKVARLQLLLFFIDRHSDRLDSQHKDFLKVLIGAMSHDDALVQSWAFMCVSALARIPSEGTTTGACSSKPSSPFASPLKTGQPSHLLGLWEQAWNYAVRRLVISSVCRAASHAAVAIAANDLVPTIKLQADVEMTLANLEVQGPTFPFDSVCAFLVFALQVVSQNVRLFRLDLEDHVLGWLVGTWNVVDGTTNGFNIRTQLENHSPDDVLRLLAAVSRFEHRPTLLIEDPLPESAVIDHSIEQTKSRIVRDFVLYRRVYEVPRPSPLLPSSVSTELEPCLDSDSLASARSIDLNDLTGRPRRATDFLLKSIEALLAEWEDPDGLAAVTPEKVRRSLDLVVLVVAYAGSLELNSVSPSRKAVKRACALALAVLPALSNGRLRLADTAVAVKGLEALLTDGPQTESAPATFLGPGPMTGIRHDLLPPVSSDSKGQHATETEARRQLLQMIWQGSELQDLFAQISGRLRHILHAAIGYSADDSTKDVDMDETMVNYNGAQDSLDFVPMASLDQGNGTDAGLYFPSRSAEWLISTCFTTVSRGTALQSGSIEPSRQKDLYDLLGACDCPQFIALGSVVSAAISAGHLHVSPAGADIILDGFQHFLSAYEYRRNDLLHSLAIDFLGATAALWIEASARGTDYGLHARTLVEYLAKQLAIGRLRAPALRSQLLRFLETYLAHDPAEQVWSLLNSDVVSSVVKLFYLAARDVDVGVRFTAASVLPRLYDSVAALVARPLAGYNQAYLETAIAGYEQSLTNTVFFTNVIIRSTILRRIAYYHLLDLEKSGTSILHLQAAIRAGARLLGFASPFDLWKIYASSVIVQSLNNSPGSEWRPADSLIGATSQQANARSMLEDLGHLLIGKGQHERFSDLVLASGLVQAEVVVESAPRALGGLLCNAMNGSVRDKDLAGDIERRLGAAGCVASVAELATNHTSAVLAQAFSELVNPGEILDDLSEDEAQLAVQSAFRELGRPLPEIYRWDSLLLPRSTARAIYRVHEWTMKTSKLDAATLPSIAFNVLYQLFSRIGRSPLLIEQIRGVYSIAYFVACQQTAFRSAALLRNLLHVALVLMEQDELAPVVDSLLLWGLNQLAHLAVEGGALEDGGNDPALPGLAEILLRIAKVADRLEGLTTRPDLSQIGYALLMKAEEVLVALISSTTEASIVESAVALWPRALYSHDLVVIRDSTSVATLGTVLDRNLSTGKFALVNRLQQIIPDLSAEKRDEFASSWFWQLKESLPSSSDLPRYPDQLRGFLDLLQTTQTQAPSLSAIAQIPRQRALEWDRRSPSVADAAKSQIILFLVEHLGSGKVDTIDTCYHVLQGVVAAADNLIKSPSFRSALAPAPDVREQLGLLGQPVVPPHGLAALPLADIYQQVPVASVFDHARWLSRLASFLARVLITGDTLFGYLLPLLDRNASFAATTLPFLVQSLVAADDAAAGAQAPKDVLSTYLSAVLRAPAAGVPVKRAIIDIVLHLRKIEGKADSPKSPADPLAHERWLNHEYLLLSRAAVECKAYTTGLLFLELQHQNDSVARSEEATQVLFSIYANIEDPDGFYGVKSSDWRSSLMQKLQHEDRWAQAFAFHGADYRYAPSASSVEGVYRSLHSFGFDRMALTLVQSSHSVDPAGADVKDDLGYDLAWRTETWDIPVGATLPSSAPHPSSNALLYKALRAVHNERSSTLVKATVADAILAEVAKMRSLSIESMSELRNSQITLVSLREIQRWLELGVGAGTTPEQWNDALPWFGDEHDFADLEKLVSVRSSLLQTVASRKTSIVVEVNSTVRSVQKELQLQLSARARDSDQLQAAINAASLAQKLDDPDVPDVGVLHEYANVLWKSEEHGMAIDIQRSLLDDPSLVSPADEVRLQRAQHLSVLGDWMSTSRLDTASRTESEYFAPAVNLIAGLPAAKEHGLVYHRFAIFAENQFRTLEKSPEIQRLRLYNDRQRQELSQLVQTNGKPRTNLPRDSTGSSRYDKVTRLQQDDAEKIRAHEETLQALLRNAIDMFGKALAVSDEFDDSLLRLASLWMSHHAREDLHAAVKATIGAVPSHKFIRIVMQLSARLEDSTTQFQSILHGLFGRLVAEHPFHCLYQLLAARGFHGSAQQRPEGDRRRSSGARSSSSSGRGKDDGPRTSRSFAAEKVLSRVAKRSATAAGRIRDVDLFCQAAIEWAWLPPDQPKASSTSKRLSPLVMDKNLKIAQISNLAIPIPTATLPIDRTCKYGSDAIVTIRGFQKEWTRAGGIHVPKVTTCIGNDGREYKQLYKSDDDIRQDAVMEQFFGIVNDLLVKDPKTRSRHLRMLTYKVVPLGDLTGFIEFVSDTMPIDVFLRRAHARYHPNDPSLLDLRKRIGDWQASYPREKVGRKFAEATRLIHPVMRYFFTEKHKTPLAWYTMRLQYSRSAAASSMIGHVVGLGDRHCSNILIHEMTGELVHIDHGVAFDGGRRLRIPELVPFRLTADIVDGLGMSGVEGVFRRCSEETMRVMRDSVETIMTILEVCKHDPMHNWGIDADKLARKQGNAELADNPDLIRDSTDEDADRALTSVRSKLSKSLSVEYTVNDLIQQARDPANLGSIFTGWQAWL